MDLWGKGLRVSEEVGPEILGILLAWGWLSQYTGPFSMTWVQVSNTAPSEIMLVIWVELGVSPGYSNSSPVRYRF